MFAGVTRCFHSHWHLAVSDVLPGRNRLFRDGRARPGRGGESVLPGREGETEAAAAVGREAVDLRGEHVEAARSSGKAFSFAELKEEKGLIFTCGKANQVKGHPGKA